MTSNELAKWLRSPRGRLVLRWERQTLTRLWPRLYGHTALAVGSWGEHFPVFPDRWRVGVVGHDRQIHCGALCDLQSLPMLDSSVDLVVLRHSLGFSDSPHQLLREANRVLTARGQLLILGFSPWSLWRLRNHLPFGGAMLPQSQRLLGLPRLVDWLHLLDFQVLELGHYGPDWPRWTGLPLMRSVMQPGFFILARKARTPVRPLRARWRSMQPPLDAVAMPPARSAARNTQQQPPRGAAA